MAYSGTYFFHIPKTAGTSVHRFLEHAFYHDEICPWVLWDQLLTASPAQLASWNVFRGHFLSHLEPFLGRRLATFTILRDPVERTVSHYYHVRRAPEHPSHQLALRMSLQEFCVAPETRHMVENYQAAYLAKESCDVRQVASELAPDYASRLELQERLQYPDPVPSPAELLARARKRLDGFVVVGVTTRLRESLKKFSAAVKCPSPRIVERANVGPERSDQKRIDDATIELISSLTAVDRQLFEEANQRLDATALEASSPEDSNASGFAMSPEDYVEALYLNCLGRESDRRGSETWVNLIRSSGDPTLVLKGIMASPEYAVRAKLLGIDE